MRLAAPLHPLLVHFSIALSISALLFDFLARVSDYRSLRDTGWWILAAAVLVTPLTVATGVRSRVRLPVEEGPARSFLRAHMALGPTVLGLLLALAVWRARLWLQDAEVSWTYLLATCAVVLVIALQGYLGGELVYRYGAEVKSWYRPLPGRGPAHRESCERPS
jgi:uncharacterized membrane protein